MEVNCIFASCMKKLKSNGMGFSVKETADLFHVSPGTVVNWVKEGSMEMDEQNLVTQKSIIRFQRDFVGKTKLHSRANKQFKDGHDHQEVEGAIKKALQEKPFDLGLGDRYENMLSESYKNKEGICYTPMHIVEDMMSGMQVDDSTTFLDPCCGTGNFLVKALEKGIRPQNLYGFDTDPNAVMIAQRRVQELTGCRAEHVVCADFLKECPALNVRFDLAFTNPPWGKKLSQAQRVEYAQPYLAGTNTDTCSLFLLAILSTLKPNGVAGLLLPESFFKIAAFEEVRRIVLQKAILEMKDYGKPFPHVMYSAVSLVVKQSVFDSATEVRCHYQGRSFSRPQRGFLSMPRCNLNYWTRPEDMKLMEELLEKPCLSLKGHAVWGLGIVTGNNGKMCKRSRRKGLVPVYRGKDILPGRLKAAHYFINPDDFPRYQQMAPVELYLAPEKLVYRFISNKLVFYCDTHQRYILNSANMLVLDNDFPVNARSLAKVLNSPLTNWLFQQLFHTHKILRGDLEILPIFTDLSLHQRFNLLNLNG